MGITLSPFWLPGAPNYVSDKLSRAKNPGDLTVRAAIRQEDLSMYAHVCVENAGAWTYRHLGAHPVVIWKVTMGTLHRWWGRNARVYCFPVDLIVPAVLKICCEKAWGFCLSQIGLPRRVWLWRRMRLQDTERISGIHRMISGLGVA